MVPDYSGSMNETIAGGVKYVAMRNAAKDLISDLEAANPETLCTNAKAKGFTVITIAYDLDDNATTNRLKNCATDQVANFFIATDTAAVASAFENIKNVIAAQVFISK